jgi:hypothetical protein
MGKLPRDFEGDRTEAENFIEEVKGYLRLNRDIARFDSPMKKIAFTLTHMKGPDVAGWTRDMGEMLNALTPAQHNVPLLWEHFLNEFEAQYQDNSAQERARTALSKLKVVDGGIDQYVSKFKELARRAGYTLGTPETIQQFQAGLPRNVLANVKRAPFVTTYPAIRERAILSTAA